MRSIGSFLLVLAALAGGSRAAAADSDPHLSNLTVHIFFEHSGEFTAIVARNTSNLPSALPAHH